MNAEYGDLLERVETLHAALKAKEQEASSLSVRNSALERQLRELPVLQQNLHKARTDVGAMDSTLSLVHEDLASTKQLLAERTLKLQEVHAYYQSILEAKESSVTSLQGLLSSNQAALEQQQQLWEEQRASLQGALGTLPKSRQQVDLVLFLERKVANLEREKRILTQQKSDLMLEKDTLAVEMKQLVRERGLLQRRLQGQEARLGEGQDELWESRVEELESKLACEQIENGSRFCSLESRLKEREKLLVKTDKRYQELSRKYQALNKSMESTASLPPPPPPVPSSVFQDVKAMQRDVQLSADALQQAHAQLLRSNAENLSLKHELNRVQGTLIEECRKREQLQARLSVRLEDKGLEMAAKDAQLASKTADWAAKNAELASKSIEVSEKDALLTSKNTELACRNAELASKTNALAALQSDFTALKAVMESAQRAAEAGQKEAEAAYMTAEIAQQSAREEEHAMRERERAMRAEFDRLQAETSTLRESLDAAKAAVHSASAEAAFTKATASDSAAQHAAQIKDMEAQLHHLAMGGGPKGLALEAELRQQHIISKRLEADLTARSETVNQLQHSLYIVRSHWGGLRQLVTRLHYMVQEEKEASKSREKGHQQKPTSPQKQQAHPKLDQLLIEWDPTSKDSFDKAAEASLAAAATLLEEASGQFQTLAHSTALARSSAEVHEAQLQSVIIEKEEAVCQVNDLQLQLVKAQQNAEAVAQSLRESEIAAFQSEQSAEAARKEAAELHESLHEEQRATADVLRQLAASSNQMAQLQATMREARGQADEDLKKQQEDGVLAQRTICDLQTNVAALHVRLEQSQANTTQVNNLKARISNILAQVVTPRVLSAPGPSGLVSPEQMDDELDKAIESALGHIQSSVAASALLEAFHWELERGLAAVALAQKHMTSLEKELAAGRMSTALVIVKEMQALMHMPTSSQSKPNPPEPNLGFASLGRPPPSHPQGAVSCNLLNLNKLSTDLTEARKAALHAASEGKTAEGMLLGLRSALPEWMQHTRIRAQGEPAGSGSYQNTQASLPSLRAVWEHSPMTYVTYNGGAEGSTQQQLANLQQENARFKSAGSALQAVARRSVLLLQALQRTLPLTPELLQGLKEGLAPSQMQIAENSEEQGAEKATDGVFSNAVEGFEQLVRSFLHQLETSQMHQVQQALDAAQEESSAVASEALHNALGDMRDEADEVQALLRKLSDTSGSAWNTTLQGLQSGLERQSNAADRAVNVLQTAASGLQGRLATEVSEHQAARRQSEVNAANTHEQEDIHANALKRAEAESASLRQQLAIAQSAQDSLSRRGDLSGRSTPRRLAS